MTCRSLEEAIVEVARGREVGRGSVAAVETHIEHCPACAARLTRERQISRGLRALADATAGECPSSEMERRLRDAFTADGPVAMRNWWVAPAAAAAAALVLLAWWQMNRPATIASPPQVVRDTRAAEPPAAGASPPRAQAPPASSNVNTGRLASPKRNRRALSAPAARRGNEFVALPAAAGLPDFESGVIVRMELPPAALPAYGIEILPDTRMPVEADLLIGQDGQPRAIRLVNRATTRSGAEQ
jgi:hypothetical protein